jgi:hypothetical protein
MSDEIPPSVDKAGQICGISALAFWFCFFFFPPLAGLCALVFVLSGGFVVIHFLNEKVKHDDERRKRDK